MPTHSQVNVQYSQRSRNGENRARIGPESAVPADEHGVSVEPGQRVVLDRHVLGALDEDRPASVEPPVAAGGPEGVNRVYRQIGSQASIRIQLSMDTK